MHPGQKLKPGCAVVFERDGHVLAGEVLERRFFGRRLIRLRTDGGGDVESLIDAIGHVPLPPYIHRADEPLDRERYQTVYARSPRDRSPRRPPGLHLTAALLARLAAAGVAQRGHHAARRLRHVQAGAGRRASRITAVDPERFEISEARGRRVDSAPRRRGGSRGGGRHDDDAGARVGGRAGRARRGRAVGRDRPVHLSRVTEFRVVRAADELPPAAVVAADAGLRVRRARAGARRLPRSGRRGYRFYSYGDAMLIL